MNVIFPNFLIRETHPPTTTSYMGFGSTWSGCNSLQTFPANCFRSVQTGTFINAFKDTNLNIQSKANILQDLDLSGVMGAAPPDGPYAGAYPGVCSILMNGGTPIALGDIADVEKQKLAAKGWNVTQVV